MKLFSLIISDIIKSDTEITLLKYDTMEQIKGRWFDDAILDYGRWGIKYFICRPDDNTVCVMLQGIKEIDKSED